MVLIVTFRPQRAGHLQILIDGEAARLSCFLIGQLKILGKPAGKSDDVRVASVNEKLHLPVAGVLSIGP